MPLRSPTHITVDTAKQWIYAKANAWIINKKHQFKVTGVFCERTVKRCVKAGKNSEKYTRKLLDKLEFI